MLKLRLHENPCWPLLAQLLSSWGKKTGVRFHCPGGVTNKRQPSQGTNRRLYTKRFLARPVSFFFFSALATCQLWHTTSQCGKRITLIPLRWCLGEWCLSTIFYQESHDKAFVLSVFSQCHSGRPHFPRLGSSCFIQAASLSPFFWGGCWGSLVPSLENYTNIFHWHHEWQLPLLADPPLGSDSSPFRRVPNCRAPFPWPEMCRKDSESRRRGAKRVARCMGPGNGQVWADRLGDASFPKPRSGPRRCHVQWDETDGTLIYEYIYKWFKIFVQYTQRFWIHEESVLKNLVFMIIPRKSPQVDTLSRSHHAMKHSILSAWTSSRWMAVGICRTWRRWRWLPMYSLNREFSNQQIKDIIDIIRSDPFSANECEWMPKTPKYTSPYTKNQLVLPFHGSNGCKRMDSLHWQWNKCLYRWLSECENWDFTLTGAISILLWTH